MGPLKSSFGPKVLANSERNVSLVLVFSFYRHECGFTDMLYKSDVGVWILAHRSIASYPKETFLDNYHKEDPTLTEYCKLVAHYGSEKYNAPELMKEALVCVFLTRCLQV